MSTHAARRKLTSAEMREDAAILVTWLVIVFVDIVGIGILVRTTYMPHRVIGAILVGVTIGAFGWWVRWCIRIAIRDRSYIRCDSCAELPGRHHK